MARLGKIGRTDRSSPQNAVAAGVVEMLDDETRREHVPDTVMTWASGRNRRNGLHSVSPSLGMWITGIHPSFLDSHEFPKSYPDQVSKLVNRVPADSDFSPLSRSPKVVSVTHANPLQT